jgi:hypothetical protein
MAFVIAHNNSDLISNMSKYNHSEYQDKVSKCHKELISIETNESTKKIVDLILSL